MAGMNKVTVAAIQMVSAPEVETNIGEARQLLLQAAAQGARLALLPEYFGIMGHNDADKVRARETLGQGRMQDFLATAAAELKMWLVGGTVPLESNDPCRVRNSVLVYAPTGERVARYDKMHLFGFQSGQERYDEAQTIERGDSVVKFTAGWGATQLQVGLSVCYDLRFPELFRAMLPVDLILVPAAFTATTGRAHWEVLLRARAIENQCYVLASGQGGKHPNGRETWGDSMLIDPWGEVVARLPSFPGGTGVLVGDLDLDRMADVRERLPALRHRVL